MKNTFSVAPEDSPLHLASTQHLDLAWLWPRVPVGEALVLAGFERIPSMLQRCPDFRHGRSTAWAFDLLERRNPALFARMAREVASGRLELLGGWWVEADEVMPGTESLLRQGMYGQWYFRSRFGRIATVGCNPDCFGHGHALPQLFNQVGIDSVYYLRCLPPDADGKARSMFRWTGPDDSGVVVLGGNWQNPMLRPEAWERRLEEPVTDSNSFLVCGFRSDRRVNLDPRWFDRIEAYRKRYSRPIVWSRFDEIVGRARQTDLPVVAGELGFTYSGTFTSEGGLKSANRAQESRLRRAETWNLQNMRFGGVDAQPLIDACWRDVLLNQFHDIQAGSGSADMHAEAHALHGEVAARLTEIEANVWTNVLREDGDSVVVMNPDLRDRAGGFELPGRGKPLITAAGRPLPRQVVARPDGQTYTAYIIEDPVPANGGVAFRLSDKDAPQDPQGVTAEVDAESVTLDNGRLRVVIRRRDAACVSMKLEGREWVAEDGAFCRLAGYEDMLEDGGDDEHRWEPWNIRRTGRVFDASVTVDAEGVSSGPCLASLFCVWEMNTGERPTRLLLEYRLWKDADALQLRITGDWQGRGCLLKMENDIAGGLSTVDVDMPGGVTSRPAMPPGRPASTANATTEDGLTPLKQDKDPDQVMVQWVDGRLADGSGGVAFLNDGRHGYDARPEGIGLSLLRGPRIRAQEFTGLGPVACQFDIVPHDGDWRDAGIDSRAEILHHPLLPLPGRRRPPQSLLRLSGDPVTVLACKQASFGPWLVVRLHERHHRKATVRFQFNVPVTDVRTGTALEDCGEAFSPVQGNEYVDTLRPDEIRTWLFGLDSFLG